MEKPTIYFCPNCDNKRIILVESSHYHLSGYFTFKCKNPSCESEFDDHGDGINGEKIDFDKIHRDYNKCDNEECDCNKRDAQIIFTDKEADLINDKLSIQYYRYKSNTNPHKIFIKKLMEKVYSYRNKKY